ncbi:DUF1232 domain-containing protein [Sphingobium sp. AS12]|uniref:YkvA family protein n=1 Tax=Sphingobium sp. AS12 TaxID=2849495 RepID=UPI001C31A538|nr:YkvA family protein [Sphingobium sp. AS12]MBV2148889.1 DUF1232 domain-containing protein [Sphingobium sp. AS12]
MLAALKAWAKRLKREVVALWIAARSADTPWFARLIALLVAAYALSPIDLIPDFIPVLGLLDDLLIVPLGIMLAVRSIPPLLMARYRAEAAESAERPSSRAGVIIVLVLWAVGLGACLYWLTG